MGINKVINFIGLETPQKIVRVVVNEPYFVLISPMYFSFVESGF